MSTSFIARLPYLLIVEDNQMMRSFLSSFFEEKGYYTTGAKDGVQALTLLRHISQPDLIITDLHMPNLDGLQLLGYLKSSPQLAEIPVLVLCGDQNSPHRLECLRSGAAEVLNKPLDPADLESRVQELLYQSSFHFD